MTGVAYAVVRCEPPQVFLADDVDVLTRVLAVELVARTDPAQLPPGTAEELRGELMEERWAAAVERWIHHTGIAVDVYTNLRVYADADLPADLVGAQLQFTPLFGAGLPAH